MLQHSSVDQILNALAVSVRRDMVDRLSGTPMSVSDLAKPFDMTLAAVVQHVQVLESCGIIRTEKIGRVRTCSLVPAGLAPLADWVAERRSLAERRLDRLDRLGEILAEAEQVDANTKSKETPP